MSLHCMPHSMLLATLVPRQYWRFAPSHLHNTGMHMGILLACTYLCLLVLPGFLRQQPPQAATRQQHATAL